VPKARFLRSLFFPVSVLSQLSTRCLAISNLVLCGFQSRPDSGDGNRALSALLSLVSHFSLLSAPHISITYHCQPTTEYVEIIAEIRVATFDLKS
jgi:hypothetical protein